MLKMPKLLWRYVSESLFWVFETWWEFPGFCPAYWNKEKRRATKVQKFSKIELKLIFVSLNQEQMNKIRSPINIRDFTK